MIHFYLGLLLVAFLITSISVVPFINLLYKLKFQNKDTDIFNSNKTHKVGTPVGGGLLVIAAVTVLFFLVFPLLRASSIFVSSNYHIEREILVLFFSFITFAIIGLYDDIVKFFGLPKEGVFGLSVASKFALQVVAALVTSCLLYFSLNINFVYIPFLGAIHLGPFYIIFATTLILIFANFFNFTDGMDGLSCGLLMISLFTFWVLAGSSFDTPVSIFLSLWIGSIIAFLYFNIPPARIWLGDVGALSFGATFAVIALILGKVVPLMIVGVPFLIEGLSSTLQILSKKYLGKKIIPIAPLHYSFQYWGWPEYKIVFRAWLAAIILTIFALWLGLN